MISKILFYSLRLGEYRWESLEMKLTKKRLNISICLCILSLSLSELSKFPQSISCFIFLWSRKRRYISRLSIILKILGFLTMVAMMWKLHSQLLFFRHHTPPPLLNRNLDHSKKTRAWRKPSYRFFAMSIESSPPKVCFWNSATLQRWSVSTVVEVWLGTSLSANPWMQVVNQDE